MGRLSYDVFVSTGGAAGGALPTCTRAPCRKVNEAG
jgi:hypothetical protein